MKGTVYELCEIKGKYSAVKVDNAEIHKRDGYAIYNAGVLHNPSPGIGARPRHTV